MLVSNNKCVGAFTIVEAVVGMVIMAIIMAVIFVIYSITLERMFDFKKQNEYTTNLNRLTYSFNKAIFESEEMRLADGQLVFTNYDGNLTRYTINKDYLVRTAGEFKDTFNFKFSALKIDTLSGQQGKEIYQRLNCNISEGDLSLNFYKKIYANATLKNIDK